MDCNHCGEKDEQNVQFCMKCGQPIRAGEPPAEKPEGSAVQKNTPRIQKMPPGRRRALAISIAVSILLLTALILVLALSANPVAGRWYSQGGTELIFLKNGKGMTVTEGEQERVHFMYAIEYREAGFIEGEIYEKARGDGAWFFVYDNRLEFAGEYFYRQRPSGRTG